MARKRRQNGFQAGELNLTAMIDVAFQLLAFFIITIHPVDVMANLDVYRPRADTGQGTNFSPLRITVLPGGYVVNGTTPMTLKEISSKLRHIAGIDKAQTIIIQCTDDSVHAQLIDFLNKCAEFGLTNLSVVSAGGN